jgi:hypothetical protein
MKAQTTDHVVQMHDEVDVADSSWLLSRKIRVCCMHIQPRLQPQLPVSLGDRKALSVLQLASDCPGLVVSQNLPGLKARSVFT